MKLRRSISWGVALFAALGLGARTGGAATSPTAKALPGPVVYQFEIERTTEPLSLFNVIPPPLPLDDVLRMKGSKAPGTGELPKGATVPATAPLVRPAVSAPGASPKTTATAAVIIPTTQTRPSLTTLPGGKSLAVKPAPPVVSAPSGAIWLPRPTPLPKPTPAPTPTPVPYPDRVVLVGNKPQQCRIIGDAGTTLRVELPNGAVVHLPKHRIASTTRNAAEK